MASTLARASPLAVASSWPRMTDKTSFSDISLLLHFLVRRGRGDQSDIDTPPFVTDMAGPSCCCIVVSRVMSPSSTGRLMQTPNLAFEHSHSGPKFVF